MIVWIASYPRSGNRLARATLRRAFGERRVCSAGTSAALRRALGAPAFRGIEVGPDEDPLPHLRRFDGPIFTKTHSLPEDIHTLPEVDDGQPEADETSPAIYLVRDGRDCLVSYTHFLRDHEPQFASLSFEEVIWDLVRDRGGGVRRGRPQAIYGGWSGHVRAWRERTAPTAIVRFEELIEDPVEALRSGAAEIGVELRRRGEAPTFEAMQAAAENPKLLRRGRAGSWRDEFPAEMLEEFWSRHGDQMDALGYSRD